MLANFSQETHTLPRYAAIGVAEEVSEDLINKINKPESSDVEVPQRPKRKRRDEVLYTRLLAGKLDHLSLEDKQVIEPVLRKYAHIFHDERSNDFKATDVIERQIVLEDTKPIKRPPYRTPSALRGEMEAQVENVLNKGVTREY